MTLTDGGEAIADPAVLRDRREVFGPVASPPTAWRLLAAINENGLDRLRTARARHGRSWLRAAETGEGMSGRLRPGAAGANTAGDHIAVLDRALARIPDAHRHDTDILVRADGAGSAKAFLTHLRSLRGTTRPASSDSSD